MPRAALNSLVYTLSITVAVSKKLFLNTLLETYLPRQEISTTTFRVNDKADLGHRKRLIQLGFVEKERLTEFGYPTQRFVFTPPKKERDTIHEK